MKMVGLKKALKSHRRPRSRYQGGDGERSPLSDFLGVYDIFILIIEELHYLDVINLSQVSKSVRQSVLPPEDFERRLWVIECYTCRSPSKFRCWTCSNTTCGVSCFAKSDCPKR